MQKGVSKPSPIEAQHVLRFAGSWHGQCKTQLCMRTEFNKMNGFSSSLADENLEHPLIKLAAPLPNRARLARLLTQRSLGSLDNVSPATNPKPLA
jgi:hypothetical protein